MNVTEVRFLHPDDRCYFKGKWRKLLQSGNDTRDDRIPGLNMTLNQQTGLVSVDAPGDSITLHLSTIACRLEPAIDDGHRVVVDDPVPVTREVIGARRPVTADDLGFDPSGDDIDDAEVARLLQGPKAKKALVKKAAKKKPGPKPKAKPAPIEDAEFEDAE